MSKSIIKLLNDEQLQRLHEHNIEFKGSHFEQLVHYDTNEIILKLPYKKPKPRQLDKYINGLIEDFAEKQQRINEIEQSTQLPSAYVYNEIGQLLASGKSLKDIEKHFIIDATMNGIHAEFIALTESKDYPDVFPNARKVKRKIIAYLGDTNSGKTYHALKEVKASTNSAYTAPLRLLALENFQRLNNDGIPTSLITGEEKIFVENSECVACTVECFSTEIPYETVVIDEIQLIDDPQRGAFFVEALIGANADNVIVTGPKEYEKRLRQIAEYLDEEIEVHVFKRHTSLDCEKKPTRLKDIKPKTALVGFSKRELYRLQKELPPHISSTLLYGSQGCEVRKKQAERFANGDVDVIITTDCIGMGLNLPIETVLFSKVEKYDGEAVGEIGTMLTKQLAGRAGRYGIFNKGFYGGIDKKTHSYVKENISKRLKPKTNKPLAVLPPESYVRLLSQGYRLSNILETWADKLQFNEESLFVTTGLENQILIAKFVEKAYPTEASTFWRLVYCPIDFHKQYHEFKEIVDSLICGEMIRLPAVDPKYVTQSDLELLLRELSMIKWFHNHYPKSFTEDSDVVIESLVNDVNNEINKRLEKR